MRLWQVGLTVGLLTGLVGCSASDGTTAASDGARPSRATLDRALLDPGNLGASYSRQPSVLAAGYGVAGCAVHGWTHLPGQSRSRRTVTAAYEASPAGPFIDEALISEPAPSAETDFVKIDAYLRNCRQLTIRPGGYEITVTLTPISFDPHSTAVRIDGSHLTLQVDGYVVFHIVDPTTMMAFMYLQAGIASSQLAYADFAQALTKADRVLGGHPAGSASTATSGASGAGTCVVPALGGLPSTKVTREQSGYRGSPTLKDPCNGTLLGVKIAPMTYVSVTCRFYAPEVPTANPDGWWYLIENKPWNSNYYAVSNTFWNGDIPGHLPYTHNTDFSVPVC
jgi:hypothetical protein